MQTNLVAGCGIEPGGGVAATVNAVVHKLVGNPNVVVYDGSMSEWAGEGLPLTKP
ncbi:MAG: 3-mercaptopyruvate sulfurtransferase SseA [Planctomycetaceae bacterium]|jgi:3-mercaptopyruvate sulfurtransferase SseA